MSHAYGWRDMCAAQGVTAIGIGSIALFGPFLSSVYIDWSEVVCTNAIEDFKIEIIFRSGAKTIVNLEETVFAGSLPHLLSLQHLHDNVQTRQPSILDVLKRNGISDQNEDRK